MEAIVQNTQRPRSKDNAGGMGRGDIAKEYGLAQPAL